MEARGRIHKDFITCTDRLENIYIEKSQHPLTFIIKEPVIYYSRGGLEEIRGSDLEIQNLDRKGDVRNTKGRGGFIT